MLLGKQLDRIIKYQWWFVKKCYSLIKKQSKNWIILNKIISKIYI
jgi:hypothetical protein